MTAPTAPQALCPSFIGAKRMRVTLVDGCGRPVYGPQSQVVSSGFVSIEIEPEVEEGEDQSQKTAGGEQCISAKGPDVIKWWNLAIEFCEVDPDMWLIMNRTWKRVTDATRTKTTGVRPALEFSDQLGFALELWPKAAGGASAVCDPTKPGDEDFFVSGYFMFPWCLGNAPESFTLENSPTTFTLNARTRTGSLWGKGPYDVTRDAQGNPAPLLDYIDPGFSVPAWNFQTSGQPDTFHIEVVTVKPPDAECGAQGLWNPDAVAPQVTVEEGDTTRTAVLTVTNWADIKSGTVDWGDGNSEPLPPGSNGTITHVYAAAQDGKEQMVTFTPGNGAKPVSMPFTPSTPPTVTGVTVSGPNSATAQGDTIQLTATAQLDQGAPDKTVTNQATWASSDEQVATVSKGTVTPLAQGTTQITATYSGQTSANHQVDVAAPVVTSITLSPGQQSIQQGQQQAYTVQGDPGGQNVTSNTTLSVSPSDPGVSVNGQTVTTTGSATAQQYTVTGTYTNSAGTDVTDTATLTVTAPAPTAITVEPASSSHAPGETQNYTATANNGGGDVTANTTFTSSDTNKVTISGNTATVQSGATGEVTITGAYTPQGGSELTDTATLTVAAPQQLVSNRVDPTRAKRGVALNLTDPPAGTLTVDWGDGATDSVSGAGPHRHSYNSDGEYTIQVTDAAGNPVTSRHVSVPFTTADPHDGQ